MASISAVQGQRPSPRDRMQDELLSQIKAGTIAASDQGALTQALDDIDSSLKSSSTQGGERPDPKAMKAKIDQLISSEVDKGTITQDQAKELTSLFAKGPGGGHGGPSGGPGELGGAGGSGGPGGGSVGGLGLGGSDDDDDDTSSSSSSSDPAKLLESFLKSLREAQSSSANYQADGSQGSSDAPSLIFQAKA
jgi:hypothetical protein